MPGTRRHAFLPACNNLKHQTASMNTNSFKPSFYAGILYQSRINPHAVAVVFGTQEVTYAEFARDIERATRQAAARVPARAGLALVTLGHPYLHWVLTIALGRLGLATASAFDTARLLGVIQPDLVFAGLEAAPAGDARFVAVDEEWIGRGGDALPPYADPAHHPDAPFRLVLSSGTTGTPKKIMLTHTLFQHRLESTAVGSMMPGRLTRAMSLIGIDTAVGHQTPLTTWFLGGRAVLLMPGEDPYQAIVRKGVNYALMAPVQLEHILRTMPADAWALSGLTLAVGGSSLPRLISQQARARLSPALLVLYGSTEAGLVSLCHASLADARPGVTGVVRPNADVEIVDLHDKPATPGTVGAVRCRTPDCVAGYLDAQDAASEEIFRDGWFYPGDAGILSDDGLLTIVGRSVELMNLGGVKIAPTEIEETLAGCPGVADIAAFSLQHEGGVETAWVAVVRGPGYDQALLARAFQQAYPRLPALKIAHADLIPRNQMGKVQRNLIREQVQRSLGPSA